MGKDFLEPYVRAVDAFFEGPLRRTVQSLGPPELVEPMLYSLLSGGKRIRPVLCLVASGFAPSESFDPFHLTHEEKRLFFHASALECIHCYSLIHDDLPSMDDDDLRRGLPSSHKKYNEWAAILAGDALNTLAFYLVTRDKEDSSIKNSQILSRCALRMVSGQYLDLSAEKGSFLENRKDYFAPHSDEEKMQLLETIHLEKTAAMIEAAIAMGAVLQGLPNHRAYAEFGRHLGLLFQMVDDLLDETQDSATLGKTAGKDKKAGKLTLVSLLGLDEARNRVGQERSRLEERLEHLPVAPGIQRNPVPVFRSLIEYLVDRDR
ncbi:MAG: polyprenyl synthetase family protein [Leptospiraceae bacterium]|nr:polyprenyl synthetase family protein [Leptospiraceae bacterium]